MKVKNQYGWMNPMKGIRWKRLLAKYHRDYERQLRLQSGSHYAELFLEEFYSQPSFTKPSTLGSITYEMRGSQTIMWTDTTKKDHHIATDLDIEGSTVWCVEDDSKGAEQYTIHQYVSGKRKWSTTRPVGPFVAVVGSRCYCIETENYLWMRRVVSLDATTGKDRRIEVEVDGPQWNLQLFKGAFGCLFALANNAGVQRCWQLKDRFEEIPGYEAFVPVGYSSPTSKQPCFFGRKTGTDVYTPVHCKGTFPSFKHQTPEWLDPITGHLCCKKLGKRTVFSVETGNPVLSVLGNVDMDTLGSWRGVPPSITIQEPGAYRQSFADYLMKETVCPYAPSSYHTTVSEDGTRVPYILVKSCQPKYLLCIVYGAYGVPTRLNTDRWKPLLDRGWGLCFALVRGGGDHTDAWAEAARRENKGKSIEDFEACIRAAKKDLGIPAAKTAVYGRSAGGYTVGTTLARHASGDLFQTVYTEVPYVDVFQTTSNPELPLTQIEYDEFGNPQRPLNAQALISLSPIDTLPPEGAPKIFVLSRTALNDKEVFAYESVKWITKLNELQKGATSPSPKLLALEDGEGHFAPQGSVREERANDLALLHSWVARSKKSHEGIYPMARRNNVTMRKRRNNTTARKNNVVGGKRRKASTRKGRKGRKGSRKH